MKRNLIVLAILFLLVATMAAAGVVKKTFDDCEKEGLQHSWIYSVPDSQSVRYLTITDSVRWANIGEPILTEITDNNAATNIYDKVIRSRKCRNCNVVEELHVKHTEEWRRK